MTGRPAAMPASACPVSFQAPRPLLGLEVEQLGHGVAVGHRPSLAPTRDQRLVVQAADEVVDGCLGVAVTEGAGPRPLRAPGEEGVDRAFAGPGVELEQAEEVVAVLPRVHGAVERQGPDPGRVEVGIHGAQVGAVGETQVAQLRVADGGAEQVEVADGVLGAGEVHQVAAGLAAARGVLSAGPQRPPHCRAVDDRSALGPVQPPDRAGRGLARDAGRAAVGAAGVETDEVEALAERLEDRGPPGEGHEVNARPARAAGIEEQRPDAIRPRRGQPVQRDGRRTCRRVAVVQRHLVRRALQRLAGPLHVGDRSRATRRPAPTPGRRRARAARPRAVSRRRVRRRTPPCCSRLPLRRARSGAPLRGRSSRRRSAAAAWYDGRCGRTSEESPQQAPRRTSRDHRP